MHAALPSVMALLRVLLCTKHRGDNVSRRGNAAVKKVYNAAVQAKKIEILRDVLSVLDDEEKYSEADRELMAEFDREMLYPAAAVEDGALTYGRTTSQMVESLNACSNIPRNLDPLAALQYFVSAERKRFAKHREESLKETGYLCKHAQTTFDKLHTTLHGLVATPLNGNDTDKFAVNSLHPNRGVTENTVKLPQNTGNIDDFGSCTCGRPAVDYFPCRHMLAAAKIAVNISQLETIVPSFYRVETWREQYPADFDYRVPSVSDARLPSVQANWLFPPRVGAPKKGRPRQSRIRSILEHAYAKARALLNDT